MPNNKLVALLVVVAFYSVDSEANNDLQSQLKQCQAIESDLKRLICYDGIKLAQTVDKPIKQVKKVEKKIEDFGLEHKKTLEGAEDKLVSTVAKVKKSAYGYLVITLENGQRWKQAEQKKFKIKSGQQVVVERGSLGSFMLKKVGSDRSVKVKRVK